MEETLFNKETTLEKAMHVFWKKGYDNTSLKDLLQAMKILNGSFYNTFGSKQKLFIQAVDLYGEQILKQRIALFQKQADFRSGLKSFFDLLLKDFEDKKNPKGCMIIGSIQPELLKDAKVANCIKSKLDIYKAFLTSEIIKAQKNKELSQKLEPEILSSLILTFTQGITKSAILREPVTKLDQQINAFIDLIY